MHNQQFAIISGTEAHLSIGRVNTLDTACIISGFNETDKPNDMDKKDFGRFLEAPTVGKLTVYGPSRNVTIYPIAASN